MDKKEPDVEILSPRKIVRSLALATDTYNKLIDLAKEERRTPSQMGEILLEEALAARSK